ncbi:MAG: YaiI/YqxD family protein [bacterium]|nr:YaiI/YqxD family protein [bacterium]
MKIWIDGDACPRPTKEIIFRAATKYNIPVYLVANSFVALPRGPLFKLIQVGKGDDMADSYIVEHVEADDIVITADIPLAALIVEKNSVAINPRGEAYTKDNVRERLSMRDFMYTLREHGVDTSGPSSHSAKDNQRFANSFNSLLCRVKKLR